MSCLPPKIVGVLTVLALMVAVIESGPTNLDCRRFVFAPACRGATIKRSSIPDGAIINAYLDSHYPGKAADVPFDRIDDSESVDIDEQPQDADESNDSLVASFGRSVGNDGFRKLAPKEHRRRRIGSRTWDH